MNPKFNKVLGWVVFAIAFAGGYLIVRNLSAPPSLEESAKRANVELQSRMEEAVRKNPDVLPSEAMRQDAVARAEARMASQTDAGKRAATAADTFWGFFFVNTRMRPEYCSAHGVDIKQFVAEFERIHQKEVATARRLYAQRGMDENKLYEAIRPTASKVIEQDMQDIAKTQKVSAKTACELLNQATAEIVGQMHISKMQPAVFSALSAAGQ